MSSIDPCYQRKGLTIYSGSCLDVLRSLPEKSVHCVVTSPPYWGLRDYGVDGQLGLEPTPEEYVANMVAVFREVRRVLRDDGTLWLNMGDCYTSGGRADFGPDNPGDKQHTQNAVKSAARAAQPHGLKPKDLVGIPWRLAFALQADGWYLRSDIIWAKPNPMPESVTDRPTKSHEYVFLLTKSARYFYDADAVREDCTKTGTEAHLRGGRGERAGTREGLRGKVVGRKRDFEQEGRQVGHHGEAFPTNGRNLRTVWTVATHPFPGAHFATFPPKLIEPCIKAGTSERGCCPECGAPWVREADVEYVKSPVHGEGSVVGRHYKTGANNFDGAGMPRLNKKTTTTGWSPTCDCCPNSVFHANCDDGIEENHDACDSCSPVPCTVLDPFWGAGTVGVVAQDCSVNAIGIELNPDYIDLSVKRLAQGVLF